MPASEAAGADGATVQASEAGAEPAAGATVAASEGRDEAPWPRV